MSVPLDKSQYTEPEWILERIRRQKEVDDAENAHRIAENAIIGHRRMVPVAGGIVVTSFVLSIFGILGTLTFLIGGGVATLALLAILWRIGEAKEISGKTKYNGSTLQALNNARHELLVWDQIDMADNAEHKPRKPIKPPANTVQLNPGETIVDSNQFDDQLRQLTSLKAKLEEHQKHLKESFARIRELESGLPKELPPRSSQPGMDPYTKYNPKSPKYIQKRKELGLGGSSEDGVLVRFRFSHACAFHACKYLLTCDKHAGHVRAYDKGELWQAMSEHQGCLMEIHLWMDNDPYRSRPDLRGEIVHRKVYP